LHFSAVWIADGCSKLTCGALAQVASMYEHTLNCTRFLAAGVWLQFKQLVCDGDSGRRLACSRYGWHIWSIC